MAFRQHVNTPRFAKDAATKQYVDELIAKAGTGGGSGEFPEAPVDGTAYGRKNEAWVRVIMSDNDVVDGGNF